MSKMSWLNMDLWLQIMENYKTVAWNQNTNMDPKNEPNYTFQILPFNKFLFTGWLKNFCTFYDKYINSKTLIQVL